MVDLLVDRDFQIAILASIAVAATLFTLAGPLLEDGKAMDKRIQGVADYKERLRQKQRADLTGAVKKKATLRNSSANGFGRRIVEQFKLLEVFDAEQARKRLIMAGLRGERPVYTFMAARLMTPVIAGLVAVFYMYVLEAFEVASFMKLIICLVAPVVGYYLPAVWLSNTIQKRQQKIQLAFPDSLDLLLICVESGMSVEAALTKVTEEVATECPELAEEFGLTTAELSYLQDRKNAYVNLGERTGLEGVKAVTTALVQCETYGTPIGSSLRVMAAENREMRMQAAEKKAAALPPKLTVPMILFFLPVLFVVILGPGIITAIGKENDSKPQTVQGDSR